MSHGNVLLSLQVANHVVQALLNQKVQLPPASCEMVLVWSGLVRSGPVRPGLAWSSLVSLSLCVPPGSEGGVHQAEDAGV